MLQSTVVRQKEKVAENPDRVVPYVALHLVKAITNIGGVQIL